MPASISHSSMLPKFLDKQRRPGIIHLPQPLTSPLRQTTKLPAHNPAQKTPQRPEQYTPKAQHKANGNGQLRTPSPSPPRRNNQSRHRQKRSSSGNVAVNNADISAISAVSATSPKAPHDPSVALVDSAAGVGSMELSVRPAAASAAGFVPLSPPPTPKVRAPKQRKGKASSLSVRRGAKPAVLPASPPLTPEVAKFTPPVEEAVFSLDISAVDLAQDSNDSLPLADDDEVIVWKQPLTPTLPSPRADNTSSRSSSPSEFVNWDDVKNLPKLSRATVAQLKEQYDIRPSKAFEQSPSSQEPDLLMSLLHASSSSCPPSPGSAPDAATTTMMYPVSSKPIPITRRPNGSHVRAPSVPAYPTSGRLAMQQYKEDVAEAFGLDVRDVMAVQKATEAWRAYAGSTFNNSPETERVPAPKFLGRLFH